MIAVWRVSKRAAYHFIPLEQTRTLDDDRAFFKDNIEPRCELWVCERGGEIVGFAALEGSYLDRLYVAPAWQRRGVGRALVEKATQISPVGLELHTHQRNHPARCFYEKHGFRAVGFGVSPPPESEPDVEYHWRPT